MPDNLFDKTMLSMTWPEVDRLAKADALVLLPLSVVEEHGYHLPLGTDLYIALEQAREVAEVMAEKNLPCVIAPPYYWGTMQVTTKNFPGSFTAAPEHIKAMLFDLLESLELAGFRRVLGINAHGDALHIRTMIAAMKEFDSTHTLRARYFTFTDEAPLYGLTGEEDFLLAVPPYPLEEMVHGIKNVSDPFDVHAGAFETALMRDLFPEMTNMEAAAACKPTMLNPEQQQQWMTGKEEYNHLTPQGYVGDPAASRLLQTDMPGASRVLAGQIIEFYRANGQ